MFIFKMGFEKWPSGECEEGEEIGFVTYEVILSLVELFALKDLVGVGLFNFVAQYSKRSVSPR